MSKYLLTYNDALKICKKYNNNKKACSFWETQYIIDGYKLCTFNYFICGWNDFENPLENLSGITGFDMRGTTFVFDKEGKLWKTFYMLPKFFNLHQVETTQYDVVKNKKIKNISIKEDGSLVAFMILPNGKLFSKTIGSFVSEQAENARTILYKNEEDVLWVKSVLGLGYTPLFEYVSWDNRIVLSYTKAEIRLIGIRDNKDGKYYPSELLPEEVKNIKHNFLFNIVQSENNLSLDDLIKKSKVEENKEGWVVLFEDDQMIKVKTDWYFLLHGLRTENIFREDYVIKNYLHETLDDLLSQLNKEIDNDAFLFVDKVCLAINNYIEHIDDHVNYLKTKFDIENDWKKFATNYHAEKYFNLFKILIEKPELYNKHKIEYILYRTRKLNLAKEIVFKYGK